MTIAVNGIYLKHNATGIANVLIKTVNAWSDWKDVKVIIYLTLVIRPHPIDIGKLDNVEFTSDCIQIDKSSDIYASIKKYSMLITDCSSLFYDSQALGIKTFLLADDIHEYNKN